MSEGTKKTSWDERSLFGYTIIRGDDTFLPSQISYDTVERAYARLREYHIAHGLRGARVVRLRWEEL